MTQRHRRDFLLDSGAISALVTDPALLRAYLRVITQRYDGAMLIAIPVLTEVRSGVRRTDVLIDRLITSIGPLDEVFVPLTVATATRAGVLRSAARRSAGRQVSTTDAQIVAIAEERSFHNAVTIVTTDAVDVGLLVDLTRRPNVAIDLV